MFRKTRSFCGYEFVKTNQIWNAVLKKEIQANNIKSQRFNEQLKLERNIHMNPEIETCSDIWKYVECSIPLQKKVISQTKSLSHICNNFDFEIVKIRSRFENEMEREKKIREAEKKTFQYKIADNENQIKKLEKDLIKMKTSMNPFCFVPLPEHFTQQNTVKCSEAKTEHKTSNKNADYKKKQIEQETPNKNKYYREGYMCMTAYAILILAMYICIYILHMMHTQNKNKNYRGEDDLHVVDKCVKNDLRSV